MENSQNLRNLNDLGEFALIEQLTKNFKLKNQTSYFGVGDDAAVISISKNDICLLSTDLLIEGVHFDVMYTPMKHLGFKSVAVNVSDICAMNGIAEQITVSIAVSSRYSLEAIEELYAGIYLACEKYKVDLVGGDTTTSVSGLTISISVLGRAKKSQVVYRSGAKEFDLLVVTGDLGAAYMGLQLLEREKAVFEANSKIQPDLDGYDYIMERQLKPEARVDVIQFFKELQIQPTSMIDISDGLASEILHICKSSKVGCHLYDKKIPIDTKTALTAIEFNLDPTTCALNGGEDYELLFTIKQEDFDKIKGNPHMTVIGHITNEKDGIYLIDKNESAIPLKAQGWKYFTSD